MSKSVGNCNKQLQLSEKFAQSSDFYHDAGLYNTHQNKISNDSINVDRTPVRTIKYAPKIQENRSRSCINFERDAGGFFTLSAKQI